MLLLLAGWGVSELVVELVLEEFVYFVLIDVDFLAVYSLLVLLDDVCVGVVVSSCGSILVFELFWRFVFVVSLKTFHHVADDVPYCFWCMIEVVSPAFVGIMLHPFSFGCSDGFS